MGEHLNLDWGTLNLDGGTLTLDGGTRPSASPYNLSTGCTPWTPLSQALSALEATFIKTSNPAFCRQKEFVYSLKIVHKWRFLIGHFPADHGSAFLL